MVRYVLTIFFFILIYQDLVSVTGTVDILSYVASMVILKYMGRKKITCVLYLFTGVCLLILQFIPKGIFYYLVILYGVDLILDSAYIQF